MFFQTKFTDKLKPQGFFCFCRDFSASINDIQIDKTKSQWHNYFLCGLKGIQVSPNHLTYEMNVEVKYDMHIHSP